MRSNLSDYGFSDEKYLNNNGLDMNGLQAKLEYFRSVRISLLRVGNDVEAIILKIVRDIDELLIKDKNEL